MRIYNCRKTESLSNNGFQGRRRKKLELTVVEKELNCQQHYSKYASYKLFVEK